MAGDTQNQDRERSSREESRSDQTLPEKERAQAAERQSVRALVVHEAIRAEGEEELVRGLRAVAYSAIAAGLSMGFSLVCQGAVEAALPHGAAWVPLISSFGYSVGFLIVTIGRQQLFTETTLTVVLPVLSNPSLKQFGVLIRFWVVVLAANLAGALGFAALCHAGLFPSTVTDAFTSIGAKSMANPWLPTFLRAILAGWLIALIVWLQPVAQAAWFWVILTLTYFVGAAGLVHVIAGAVDTLYVVLAGEKSVASWLWSWLLPALLGNIVGGVSLVAALNHAQARAQEEG